MADDLYAWSRIEFGATVDKETGVRTDLKVVNAGDKVTKAKLGVSDEEWDSLIEGRVVRDIPFPEGVTSSVSPRRAILNQLDAQSEEDRARALLKIANEDAVDVGAIRGSDAMTDVSAKGGDTK